jgi:hypothetical protein
MGTKCGGETSIGKRSAKKDAQPDRRQGSECPEYRV